MLSNNNYTESISSNFSTKTLCSFNQFIDLGVCPYDITRKIRNFGNAINDDVYLNGSFNIPFENEKFVFHETVDTHWIEFSNRSFEWSYDYDDDEQTCDYPHIFRTKVHIPYKSIPNSFTEKVSLLIKLPKSTCSNRLGKYNIANSYGTHIEFIISKYGINQTTEKKFMIIDSINFYTISSNVENLTNLVFGDRTFEFQLAK
jgi:hypothetical protein